MRRGRVRISIAMLEQMLGEDRNFDVVRAVAPDARDADLHTVSLEVESDDLPEVKDGALPEVECVCTEAHCTSTATVKLA